MLSLTPEHLEDLRKSGLSDTSIEILQIQAVRPHDIKIPGVKSAYRIPYFNLDGSINGFERWRLFPPVKRPDGSTQKYHQAAGTAPQFHLSPCLSWQNVAGNPKCELVIAEGEKKEACANERGLIALGIAGVWNWRLRQDNGERITIPILNEFVWTNRSVILCPDSDVWRPDKEQALLGMYAFGMDLVSRGAVVKFVRLPEPAGVKVGLDDWLVQVGDDWERQWPSLERITLDDAKLATLAASWQRWYEKQVSKTAIQQHDADELTLAEVAGLYTVRSAHHSVTMTFDRLTDARGSVSAELTVCLGATELLSGVDLGLKSAPGQAKLASELRQLAPTIPWGLLLRKACALVMKRHREGEPPQQLSQETRVDPLSYAVYPLVFHNKPTILYGDGGLGKSTLALFLAMCVATGQRVAGFTGQPGRPLFLDYEDDADVHARRLHAIIAGHPELAGAVVHYQRCVEPLTRQIHGLVRFVQANHITVVFLDSLIAATGGDASAEATTKLFAAMRVLKVEILALGHVPKSVGEGQEHPTVYGSVFNQNFARSVWELKKEQEVGDSTAILGLFNRKSNLSHVHHPLGVKVTHTANSTHVRYEACDLSETADLSRDLPLTSRIRNLLEDGTERTSKQIADELDLKWASIKVTLSRHAGRKWMKIGLGQDVKWTVLHG